VSLKKKSKKNLHFLFLIYFKSGFSEYENNQIVIDGFLAPVFCLNFKSSEFITEISAKSWENQFQKCGFENVETKHVFDYW
jgi:hypothetical protein